MVFTVNSAADTNDGACNGADCTLREAIIAANTNSGADTINFQIGTGAQTITLTSALPTVIDAVTIDGTTQPGFSGKPIIELNGDGLAKGIPGLLLGAGNSTVRGLVINRFDSSGIEISTNNNVIQGNFIGTNVAGTSAMGNSQSGILITGGSNNLIGGTSAEARNVISGNLNHGVLILGSTATGNQVKGNIIGLDFSGTNTVSNFSDGVSIFASPDNIVGGAESGARNVISGNSGKGVSILISDSTGNQVVGNFIGTDITGTLDRGNGIDGIDFFNGVDCIIGGATTESRNVISGNGGFGIRMNLSSGNQIKGNFIGTRADGAGAIINNGHGISIANSSNDNLIGGTASGEANTIANNLGAGVFVEQGTGNSIQSNSIFSNGGLGIDLAPQGVTPNDSGDGDGGPNNMQNFPLLTAAGSAQGGGSNFQGMLNSTPGTSYRIEFFANTLCDATGNGEGRTFIGATQVMTDGSGNAGFNATFQTAVPLGSFITATATDPSGNTSEFSACLNFVALADLSISKGATPDPAIIGANITFTITVSNSGPDAAQSVTVTDNLPSSVTFLNCSSTLGGVCGGMGNNRTITFNSIPAQASAVITIAAVVNCAVINGSSIVNTAMVASAATPDPDGSNNSSASTTIAFNPSDVLTPASAAFTVSGGSGMIAVTIPAGCMWSAVSNAPWITITSGSSGTGEGTVQYQVAANSSEKSRIGAIIVAGDTFTVRQEGTGAGTCDNTINPTFASFSAVSGRATISVSALGECLWTATSDVNWVTINSGSIGIGNGTVEYSVMPNATGAPRVGTITVAGKTFTVKQKGS
jgi:uncharacterized repeat protein (TIGR01451 family)/CSLREA domain-containing protein